MLFSALRLWLLAALLVAGTGCAQRLVHRNHLYQYSTIDALLSGVYDGDLTYGQLKHHGDFGLGTFEALDGEMVALDGKFYQVRHDGSVRLVDDSMVTPFALVTFFHADQSLKVTNIVNIGELQTLLDGVLPTKNTFFAIKVDGEFNLMVTRSIPPQTKPYPTLMEASRKQVVFDLHNVRGTLVGFRCPDYAKGMNVAGYHFHFISADRQHGGHVLSCAISSGKVKFAENNQFVMVLPRHGAFQKAGQSKNRDAELEQIEKGTAPR